MSNFFRAPRRDSASWRNGHITRAQRPISQPSSHIRGYLWTLSKCLVPPIREPDLSMVTCWLFRAGGLGLLCKVCGPENGSSEIDAVSTRDFPEEEINGKNWLLNDEEMKYPIELVSSTGELLALEGAEGDISTSLAAQDFLLKPESIRSAADRLQRGPDHTDLCLAGFGTCLFTHLHHINTPSVNVCAGVCVCLRRWKGGGGMVHSPREGLN